MASYRMGRYNPGVEYVEDSKLLHYKVDLRLNNREIATKTGLSMPHVGKRLRSLGFAGRASASAVMAGYRDEELINLVNKGQTGVEIGTMLHCSEFTVRRRLSVLGLKLKTSKNTVKTNPRPPTLPVKPTGFSKGSSLLRSFRYDSVLGK